MNNGYLPAWLYGALPFSYFACGLAAIIILQNRIAVASGAIMVGVSCLIAFLRLRPRPRPRKAAAPVPDRLPEMSWRKSYECGHRALDEQRRRVFGLSNELIDAVLTRKPKADVELMLQDFLDYLERYFAAEEALLEAAGRPLRAGHKEAHQALLDKAGGLMSQYRRGHLALADLIGFISCDVLTKHMVRESAELAAGPGDANPAGGWSDTEKRRRESQDTVLRMIRAEPEAGNPAFLSLAALDRLTPAKALFNSYPHVWQRICVLTQQPRHLESYLDGLLGEQGGEGAAAFSLPALKEIGDIYTQNLRFMPD